MYIIVKCKEISDDFKSGSIGPWRLRLLKSPYSFCLPRVPFVNCRQFMYLVISLLVLRAGYGIWLYQFLIIAYHFTPKQPRVFFLSDFKDNELGDMSGPCLKSDMKCPIRPVLSPLGCRTSQYLTMWTACRFYMWSKFPVAYK